MLGGGRGGGCKVFHEVALQNLIEKVVGIRVVDKCLSQFGKVIMKQSPIRRDFIIIIKKGRQCKAGRE